MAELGFSLRPTREGRTVELSLAGEFDRAVTRRVEGALDEALATPTDEIVVDLRAVTFLDLAAIRTLLCAHAHTHSRGVALSVVRPCGTASRIFTLTKVGDVLALTDPRPSVANRSG